MQARPEKPRLAWAITGSGHYLDECIEIVREFEDVDLFYSRAGEEVVRMYGHDPKGINEKGRVYRDRAASSPPVGLFYRGDYHTLVVAPATSNTVAKMVLGFQPPLSLRKRVIYVCVPNRLLLARLSQYDQGRGYQFLARCHKLAQC